MAFPKKDIYLKKRGNTFKIYKVYCENCNVFLFRYQKDGPGILKRLYLDRIDQIKDSFLEGRCHKCGNSFGLVYIYLKEKRPAIRLFDGSIRKNVDKQQ